MGRVKALLDEVGPEEAALILAGEKPAPIGTATASLHIGRAKQAAAAMDVATTRLNAAIEKTEKEIAALNLGVTASVPFESEDDREGHWVTRLRFGKEAREWRLMVDTFDGSDEPQESPLLSCSRETRLNSLKVLPALFVAVVEEAEREAKVLDMEVRNAEQFVRFLETK